MTREEKKAYLSTYVELKRAIEALLEEYHFWKEAAKSIPAYRISQTGIRSTGKRKNPVVEHLDICQRIEEKQKEAQSKMDEILSIIDKVPNSEQRTLLKYRYINGKYLYEIAKLMNYSIDGLYKLLRRAIDAVEIGQ